MPHSFDTDYVDSRDHEELPDPEPDTRVSSGRGMLASMLSWIRGVASKDPEVRAAAAVASPTALSVLSPASFPVPKAADGKFDPAELMRDVRAYHERYKSRLYGDGLVIGLDTELPPPAFPSVARLPGFTGTLDTLSFLASDYENIDAAHQAISEAQNGGINFIGSRSPRQIAWLINAACVRGALAMAPYAEGEPVFLTDPPSDEPGERTVRAVFHSVVDGAPVAHPLVFGLMDNPMMLGRATRTHLASICQFNFERASNDTVEEFTKSFLKAARLPFDKHTTTNPFDSSVQRSATFGLLKRSYVAFSNLPGVVRADKAFLPTLDRQAITDSLRHSSSGFSLVAYLAHTDETVQADVAVNRHFGALALAHYSESTLSALTVAHCPNCDRDGGALASEFMRAIGAQLGPTARATLATASPRYLGVLVLGSGKHRPLTSWQSMASTCASFEAAGKRLGRAIDELLAPFLSPGKLPWAAVFTTEVAMELMTSPESDNRCVRGLVTLFEVANALRSKGSAQGDLIHLPESGIFLAAPDSNRVGSVMQIMGRTPQTQTTLASKAMLGLAAELFSTVPSAASTSEVPYRHLSTSMEWNPVMASHSDDAAKLTLALRGAGGGKAAWARVMLISTAVPDDAGNQKLAFQVVPCDKPFNPLYDAKRKPAYNTDESTLRTTSGRSMRFPTLREVDDESMTPAQIDAKTAHIDAIRRTWTSNMATLTRSHPVQMAALFEPIAASLATAGASTLAAVKPIGKKETFRLARVCLARSNAAGMQLVLSHALNPLVRTASGISLLDVALESKQPEVAAAGLSGLATNPALINEPQLLTDMVQSSLGKLVERHPELLEMAVTHGAVMDESSKLAWAALHPTRISSEAQAAMTAAAMRGVIAQASVQSAAPPEAEPTSRRRRMGV